jgi:hypothetical protein
MGIEVVFTNVDAQVLQKRPCRPAPRSMSSSAIASWRCSTAHLGMDTGIAKGKMGEEENL